MVRTLVIEDCLKGPLDEVFKKNAYSILVGSIYEEKRYVLAVFQVPLTNSIEEDFESSVHQLLYALPGGSYPIGIICNEKVVSLINILIKGIQRLQKLKYIDETLLEPLVVYRTGNKIEGKVFIDGQLKPLSTKFQSFFSSWNEVCSYININQTIVLPSFSNVKSWKSSFRTEIRSLIKNLHSCKILFKGNSCKGEKSFFEDPGKSKNTLGKVLHPKLILPLVSKKNPKRTNVSAFIGSLYTHIFIPPKISTEKTKDLIMEDIAKSLHCRAESYCEFAEQEIGSKCESVLVDSTLRLPYRVTFPLGLIELSIYLLQDEKISQAVKVASELFGIEPTSIRAHEECKELSAPENDPREEEKDTVQLRNIILATLGGIVAVLISFVFVSNNYPLG